MTTEQKAPAKESTFDKFMRKSKQAPFVPIGKCSDAYWMKHDQRRKERDIIFNDALNTFYLWLYDVRQRTRKIARGKPVAATQAPL